VIPVLHGIDLVAPSTLDDALGLLASDSSARPFAGGTDLMVLLEAGRLPGGRYVSLWGLNELRAISTSESGALSIGALTTFTEIRRSEEISRRYPMLAAAAGQIGGVATQNRATLGGNIANASPAADSPPALIAYDAELELVSMNERRRVPYADFHLGYKQMRLRAGEIIASVILPPRGDGWRDSYRKVGTRRAQAISKVCLAAALRTTDGVIADVRLALGSVAPTVVRCRAAEDVLRGRTPDETTIHRALGAIETDIAPIDDIRSTAEYRTAVARNLVADFLRA
jgi:CO/xanthine dehydrogenase FAD-binding subunit